MEKTKSEKDKEHIITDGFRYRKDRTNADGSTSWRCYKRDCKGRIKLTTADASTLLTEHSHAPDPEGNEVQRTVAEIRRRAVETVERPRQIIQQSSVGISLHTACILPSYTASQRAIERRRKRDDLPTGNATALNEIDIPEALRRSTRDANFLLWDSGSGLMLSIISLKLVTLKR